jgi:hypothetical protein
MEKTLDDKFQDRLSNAGSINLMICIFLYMMDHFIKSGWNFLYFLLAFSLVNAVVMVSIFYKAHAKRDQLIRYKKIRNYFIFNFSMIAILIWILTIQIRIHS